MEILRFCAKNDSNGNPRRIFVAVENGCIVAAQDEGYEGYYAALCRLPGNLAGAGAGVLDIPATPAEYNRIRKTYGEKHPRKILKR